MIRTAVLTVATTLTIGCVATASSPTDGCTSRSVHTTEHRTAAMPDGSPGTQSRTVTTTVTECVSTTYGPWSPVRHV